MFRVDFSGMDKKLSSVIDEVEKIQGPIMRETAEQAIKTIVSRTRRKNQDRDGKAFAPYSTLYENKKNRDGASSRVNLTGTGQKKAGRKGALKGNRQGGTMLNSLTIVKIEDSKTRYIIGAARRIEQTKLSWHVRGEGSLPKRNPLGFTRAEEKSLIKRANKQFLVKIRNIGLK